MNKRQRALTSLAAIFALLAFVCLSWTKADAAAVSQLQASSKIHHIYRSGPATLGSYLVEVKPRLTGLGTGDSAPILCALTKHSERPQRVRTDVHTVADNASVRPIWLLNRSLLI